MDVQKIVLHQVANHIKRASFATSITKRMIQKQMQHRNIESMLESLKKDQTTKEEIQY
jgi:hypothetical protein